MNIKTVEIPRPRWASFLDTVDRFSVGRPVRIEVAQRELGDQELTAQMPLRGIELEEKGSERGDLVLLMGRGSDEAFEHRIDDAQRLYIGHNEAMELQWIAIEEPEGAKTIIYFEHPPLIRAEAYESTSPSPSGRGLG